MTGGGPPSPGVGSAPVETWWAPAKINLWLEIVGRRTDGYHLLDTAFQTIDLGDRVILEQADRPGVTCAVTGEAARGVPEDDENLVARAARLIAERTGHEPRVAITVEKSIPMAAGLGGGSSDAAAVLTALARRFAVPDPARTLRDLALELGADVPFFLEGGTRLGGGVGEDLVRADPPEERWGVLVVPRDRVLTTWAFRSWDAQTDGNPEYRMVHAGRDEGIAGWTERGNDLERLVAARHPDVMRALVALRHGPAVGSRMTGTGSAVFGLYASAEERDSDLSRVRSSIPERARALAFELADRGVHRIA